MPQEIQHRCLVLAPRQILDRFEPAIDRALHAADLTRVLPPPIHDLLTSIRDVDIVLADVSKPSPAISFELGIAAASAVPIVYIAAAGSRLSPVFGMVSTYSRDVSDSTLTDLLVQQLKRTLSAADRRPRPGPQRPQRPRRASAPPGVGAEVGPWAPRTMVGERYAAAVVRVDALAGYVLVSAPDRPTGLLHVECMQHGTALAFTANNVHEGRIVNVEVSAVDDEQRQIQLKELPEDVLVGDSKDSRVELAARLYKSWAVLDKVVGTVNERARERPSSTPASTLVGRDSWIDNHRPQLAMIRDIRNRLAHAELTTDDEVARAAVTAEELCQRWYELPANEGTESEELSVEGADFSDPGIVSRLTEALSYSDARTISSDAIGLTSDPNAVGELTEWFDHSPTADHVTYLLVVAFLGGADEATLEHEYEELRLSLDIGAYNSANAAQASLAGPDRRSRVGVPWLERRVPHPPLVPDWTIDLRSGLHRYAAIQRLWTDYGPNLWEPARRWIEGVPLRLNDSRAAYSLARGLACLADNSFAQVRQVLDRWWNGTPPERLCAMKTASCLALNDKVAPALLAELVAASAQAPRPRLARSWTSEIVMGGPIGRVFSSTSVPLLWNHLLAEPNDVSASFALWHLLVEEAAEDELPATILEHIRADIRDSKDKERSARLVAAIQILGARFRPDEYSAVVGLRLAQHEESREPLAAIVRTALLDTNASGAASSLLTAIIRRSRAEDNRGAAVALLSSIEWRRQGSQTRRLLRTVERLVKMTLRAGDLREEDAVFKRWLHDAR